MNFRRIFNRIHNFRIFIALALRLNGWMQWLCFKILKNFVFTLRFTQLLLFFIILWWLFFQCLIVLVLFINLNQFIFLLYIFYWFFYRLLISFYLFLNFLLLRLIFLLHLSNCLHELFLKLIFSPMSHDCLLSFNDNFISKLFKKYKVVYETVLDNCLFKFFIYQVPS